MMYQPGDWKYMLVFYIVIPLMAQVLNWIL